jgi:hypothetical protein
MICAMSLMACLEKEEGCLDPNALNLDVTADVNANCDYPSIRFNVSHRWIRPMEGDSLVFRLNQLVNVPASEDSVIFSSIRFYLSNVVLGGSEALVVMDSIRLTDDQYVENDLMLLSTASFQFATGDINRFGTFNGLEFDVGYDQEWIDVDTSFLQNKNRSHVWFNNVMRNDEVRYRCQLDYTIYGPAMVDTVRRVMGLEGPGVKGIVKTGNFNVSQANHADVDLFLDYRRLFQDVELRQADSVDMMEQIINNIQAALHVVQ